MRILLIGATGQLGSDLLRNNPGHDILAPSRAVLDLDRPEQAAGHISAFRPDVVLNCAAYHDVPGCEDEPDRSFRVNCIAVRDIASVCREYNTWFVTFSTDYVFDGNKRLPYHENDCPAPLQIYGITRYAGERAALGMAPKQTIIIRTCGLFGRSGGMSKGGNFVDKRVTDARNGVDLEMSCEQTVCPTSTDDLSKAVFDLLGHPKLGPGICHLGNEGSCTWFEFTKAIYEMLGIKANVRPVDREGRTGKMRRPLYSVLANTHARALGIVLPEWRDALARYLLTRYPEHF